MYVVAFCISLLVIILIMSIYILKYNNNRLQQESQIKNMDKTIESLKQKLQETNNRKTYRVATPITECEFEFIEIGKQVNISERKKGVIRDISVIGLRFESNDDFSVREKLIVKIFFVLNDEPLEILGRVIRKDESFGKPYITYGLEFMKTNHSMEQELFRLIREVELETRKKKID